MIFRKKKVVAIVQARMASTRLPGKVMMPLDGILAIHVMINRVKQSKVVDDIVVATTSDPSDDILRDYCFDVIKCSVYRGSTNDVLGRVLKAADIAKADIIVDLTADCPFVDPEHIAILVREVKNNNHDYASNVITRSWPDGFDVQVYSKILLERVNNLVELPSHRSHVGWNITNNINNLRIDGKISLLNYKASKENFHPDWGLTLDEKQDYELLNKIFKHFNNLTTFKNKSFGATDIIHYIKSDIEMLKLNNKVIRKIPGQG